MKVVATELCDVLEIDARAVGDERGWFLEAWHAERYGEAGIPGGFVQDNVSFSRRGVLRGLHFQHPHGQAKLVGVLQGEVWDVAVDVRAGSPSFCRWVGRTLSERNRRQLFIPAGFAHGFVVLSDTALFWYKCSSLYRPEAEGVVRWDDPALGIRWPLERPTVSARDAGAPALADLPPDRLPPFRPS
jgi:dTDP-4-dehydrorhamnose 3,5-epimerase